MNLSIESSELTTSKIVSDLNDISSKGLQFSNIYEAEKSSLVNESSAFVSIVISATSNVALGILSSYLYDLMKNYSAKIKVNKKIISSKEELEAHLNSEIEFNTTEDE